MTSRGETYRYEIPLGDGDLSAWLLLPQELCRADADKLKRVIDALAFDDAVLARWDQQRAARQLAQLIPSLLVLMWLVAPQVAAGWRPSSFAAGQPTTGGTE